MSEIAELKKEIDLLKQRNKRVETNKAWETSTTRKLALTSLTYVVTTITFVMIDNPNPYLNAVIPTLGFFLSTLTLPFIKNLWEKIYRNEQ
jgi:Mn2+/Fe2+ NRAMP family transporter